MDPWEEHIGSQIYFVLPESKDGGVGHEQQHSAAESEGEEHQRSSEDEDGIREGFTCFFLKQK